MIFILFDIVTTFSVSITDWQRMHCRSTASIHEVYVVLLIEGRDHAFPESDFVLTVLIMALLFSLVFGQ